MARLKTLLESGFLKKCVCESASKKKKFFLKLANLSSIACGETLNQLLIEEHLKDVYDRTGENDDDDDVCGMTTKFILDNFDLDCGSKGNMQMQYIKLMISSQLC